VTRTCFLPRSYSASRDRIGQTFATRGSHLRRGSIPKACFRLDVKASSRYMTVQVQLRGSVTLFTCHTAPLQVLKAYRPRGTPSGVTPRYESRTAVSHVSGIAPYTPSRSH
jgi:hypothetical protein